MPEGDTLFRIATTLRKALLGEPVRSFELCDRAVAAPQTAQMVPGRTVAAVEARGKNLLVVFRNGDDKSADVETTERLSLSLKGSDLVLHTHLRMTGSWHVYRHGEVWGKPQRYAKAVLSTEALIAICFSAPVVQLMTAREAARHEGLNGLGPDAMTPEFDPDEARRRIRSRPDLEIGVAVMNQRAMAGVGNVYKSETLFICRMNPFRTVAEMSDEELDTLIATSHNLLRANDATTVRRTIFTLAESKRLWVYGRSGAPCRVCGTIIRMRRQGYDARSTYYCPQCQCANR